MEPRFAHKSPRLLSVLLIGCAFLAGCSRSNKQYPNQPLTIVCPWAAGGGSDRLSRFMADQLQFELGQPVVVANKTGGSGAVGFAAGANAPSDGYTITMATFELSTMHWLGISKLTYQNFTPLIQLNGDAAAIIVPQSSPYSTLNDLLQFIRNNPGKLKMSGTAKGAAWDLARSGFLMAAGLPVDSVIWVPAKGAAPAIVDLLGGHIDAVSCSVPEALTQIESGQLKVLAVMAPERLAEFPQIPTCKELGIAWEAVGYRGLALPRDTPTNVVNTLAQACMKIVQSDQFKTFMKKNGFAPAIKSPAEFNDFLRQQDAQWQKVILGSNIGASSIHAADSATSHDPGPWAMPIGLTAALLVGLSYQALKKLKRPLPVSEFPVSGSITSFFFLLLAFALYLMVMPWAGFFTSTALLSMLTVRWLGKNWITAFVGTFLLLAAVYLLFVRLFKVPLPKGFLF